MYITSRRGTALWLLVRTAVPLVQWVANAQFFSFPLPQPPFTISQCVNACTFHAVVSGGYVEQHGHLILQHMLLVNCSTLAFSHYDIHASSCMGSVNASSSQQFEQHAHASLINANQFVSNVLLVLPSYSSPFPCPQVPSKVLIGALNFSGGKHLC